MANEAREVASGQSAAGCVLRILIAGVVVVALGAAGLVFYRAWLNGAAEGANPNLDPVRRVYLEYYLAQHVEELAQPAGAGTEPVSLTIAPGEGASAIAANLSSAGLLANTELFLNYLTFHGLDGTLVSGDYLLDPTSTIPELAEALSSGRGGTLELRFLPGWRSEEMAEYLRVVRPARIDAGEFLIIVQTHEGLAAVPAFLSTLPPGTSLEGYLFPDTYQITPDTTSAELVELMLANFDRQVSPAMRQSFGVQGLTLRDALILASVIEREAALAEEKPIMAGVFGNRLAADMRLQADPTVQYALGYQAGEDNWWKTPLTAEDLQVESPYNTYLYDGLPPGPIANPDLSSLMAVAEPTETDYLYFVLDCAAEASGRHVFSATYEEHLANVERCR